MKPKTPTSLSEKKVWFGNQNIGYANEYYIAKDVRDAVLRLKSWIKEKRNDSKLRTQLLKKKDIVKAIDNIFGSDLSEEK